MSRLALYLLGPPRIELDGEEVHVGRRKAVALLTYLAVTRERHGRDSLATLLWPEFDQSRARAEIRRTLSLLNRTLGEEWLKVDRETAGLDPDADVWLDVAQFRQHLAACETHGHTAAEVCPDCFPLLEAAVALYTDGFMAGFTLRDSLAFDEWQFFQTEGLRDGLASALQRLVRWHGDQAEYEAAIACARRWLALDLTHEPVHRHLMTLYAQSGQQSAALRQYRLCLRTLEEELDLPPSEETIALYERIRAELARPAEREAAALIRLHPTPADLPAFLRPAQDAILTQKEVAAGVERSVIVAREGELARLDGYLEAALAGQGQVVFVTGGPGRGKTALMDEFSRRSQAVHADLLVAMGACDAYSGVGDPYLPFREVMGMLAGDVEARWAAGSITRAHAQRLWERVPLAAQALLAHGPHLLDRFVSGDGLLSRATVAAEGGAPWLVRLREWVERGRGGSAGLEQSFFFEQYSNTLRALADDHPLLLLLDDLQWADAGSVGLLFHLARRMEGSRILVVGAYRPEEVALGRAGEQHPLEKVLAELKRHFGDVWVSLERMEQEAERRFLDAFLDTEPNRLDEVFRRAFFRHTEGHPLFTVELLRALQERGGLTRDAEGRWVVSGVLNWEALPARVEGVIEARVGRLEEELKDILRVASVEGEAFTAQVVAQVQEIGERLLLRELSQELEKRHRLVREERHLDVGRRRLFRYRFAHALFQAYLYNSLGKAERQLLHREVAGVLEELYEGQTDEIVVQLAHHYGVAGEWGKAIEYSVHAGERARLAYANDEAVEHYRRALALLGPRSGPPVYDEADTWRLAALKGLGWVFSGTGKPVEAEGWFREAVTLGKEIGLAPREMARLYHWLGEVVIWQGRVDERIRIGEEGLALLGDDTESVEAALMNQALATGCWAKGDLKHARELTYRSAQIIQRLPYCVELGPVYNHVIIFHVLEKDVDGALKWLRALEKEVSGQQELTGLGHARYFTGSTLNLKGDLKGAIEPYQRAVELFTRIGDTRWAGSSHLPLASNYLALGELHKAEECAGIGLKMTKATRHSEQVWAQWLVGQVSLCQGDGEKAVDGLQKALKLCREFDDGRESQILHTLGRAYLAQGNHVEARRRFEEAIAVPQPKGDWPVSPPSVLSGLELAYDDPDAFRAFCRRLRKEGARSSFLPLVQWFLEPAAPREFPQELVHNDFVGSLSPDWVWSDPFDDCSYEIEKGLEIHAANGRDLWFANLSTPRVLRLAPRETDWAAQTACGPIARGQPAIGGRPAIGGLVLWQDAHNYVCLDRGAAGEHEISFTGCLGNEDVIIGRGRLQMSKWANVQISKLADRITLRLECIDGRVRALCSADGEEWFGVGEVAFPITDSVQIGLHAIGWIDRTVYHGAYRDGTAIGFESFQLWGLDR